jgi:WhiB family redox-sensing transcriptional regulator
VIFQRADWMNEANCRGMDPDLFHPERGKNTDSRAKAACAECPVVKQCRRMALDDYTLTGYWGGMSYKDRQRWRAMNNRAAEAFESLREMA